MSQLMNPGNHSLPVTQIMRAGGWESGTWATSYCLRLPRKILRVAAGFGQHAGSYSLKRAARSPAGRLLHKVLPWVDEAEAQYQGLVPDPDIAGRILKPGRATSRRTPRPKSWQHPASTAHQSSR